jgi:hypothetical protein
VKLFLARLLCLFFGHSPSALPVKLQQPDGKITEEKGDLFKAGLPGGSPLVFNLCRCGALALDMPRCEDWAKIVQQRAQIALAEKEAAQAQAEEAKRAAEEKRTKKQKEKANGNG